MAKQIKSAMATAFLKDQRFKLKNRNKSFPNLTKSKIIKNKVNYSEIISNSIHYSETSPKKEKILQSRREKNIALP